MLLAALAWAGDSEGARLKGELQRHAQQNQWTGVERTYRKLLIDHPLEALDGYAHMQAAIAARTQGHLLAALQRLQRVPADAPEFEDAEALTQRLRSSTRLVELRARGLEPSQAPFDPTLARAIGEARRQLDEKGWFVGLVPSGTYVVDGEELHIPAGDTWWFVSGS